MRVADEADGRDLAEHARTLGEREDVCMLVRAFAKRGAEWVVWRLATVERRPKARRAAGMGRSGRVGSRKEEGESG